MLECVVECGIEKTLKLTVEYDVEGWMMVDSTWWQSDWSSLTIIEWW